MQEAHMRELGKALWLEGAYKHRAYSRELWGREQYALSQAISRRWQIALYVSSLKS
jgi:hypothetical protein